MTNLHNLTVAQLRKVVTIKQRMEVLQDKMDAIIGSTGEAPDEPAANGRRGRRKKRRMSAAARARIGAAQKGALGQSQERRRASVKAAKPVKKKRNVSAAARARLSAIAKARWAKVKASGKSTL